jgi:hypothetical protein
MRRLHSIGAVCPDGSRRSEVDRCSRECGAAGSWVVRLPEGERRAARSADHRLGGRHSDHSAAAQQPNQTGLVIAGKSSVGERRLLGRRMKAEQIAVSPSKSFSLIALDRLLPVGSIDVIWASAFEFTEWTTKTT